MEHVVKALQKVVMLKVLLCLLFLFDHHHLALATSGGVMGGSDFSSFSDSYSSASDSLFSSASDSSYNSYSSRSRSSYSSYSSLPARYSSDNSNSSSRVYPTPPIGSIDIFIFTSFAVFLICCYIRNRSSDLDKGTSFKTSVFKLQVGLLGTARSLQKDLNEIAKTANTSTADGFRHILKGTIAALLQHPDHHTSGYSCVENGSSVEEAEKRFQKISSDERSKFDEETLVNLNNIIKKSTSQKSDDEYIVAAMVLWTPQKKDDTLSEQELRADYPLMCPL